MIYKNSAGKISTHTVCSMYTTHCIHYTFGIIKYFKNCFDHQVGALFGIINIFSVYIRYAFVSESPYISDLERKLFYCNLLCHSLQSELLCMATRKCLWIDWVSLLEWVVWNARNPIVFLTSVSQFCFSSVTGTTTSVLSTSYWSPNTTRLFTCI